MRKIFVLILFVSLAGCATPAEEEVIVEDLEELRDEVEDMIEDDAGDAEEEE